MNVATADRDNHDQFTDDTASVAFSSRISAAFRATEQTRPNPLFRDEYAHVMAGPTAMHHADEWIPHDNRVSARVHFIDSYVDSQLLKYDQLQIVMVACGMETRSFRLNNLTERSSIFELDVGQVIDFKERLLAGIHPLPSCPANIKRVKVLFSADQSVWVQSILESGFKREQKTLWLTDGLLFFLNHDTVARLMEDISNLSSDSSLLCTDLMMKPWDDSMGSGKREQYHSLFKSHTLDPEGFLRKHSFEMLSRDEIGGSTIPVRGQEDVSHSLSNFGHVVVTAAKTTR